MGEEEGITTVFLIIKEEYLIIISVPTREGRPVNMDMALFFAASSRFVKEGTGSFKPESLRSRDTFMRIIDKG
jgi:hypothetical protein